LDGLPTVTCATPRATGSSRKCRAPGKNQALRTAQVSVNLSGLQFAKQDVPRLIRTAPGNHRRQPRALELEITESVIMAQPDRAVKTLSAIRHFGVHIALDDFGTDYSSFSDLQRFPIAPLKIDRSFVRDISAKQDNTEIVAAIIARAHILKLRVVAEGIEEFEQYAILAERSCDAIQGYRFQAPVAAEQVPALLQKYRLRIA
jgi:EAL domain-containing protein (putative c-di-GMP-specific phosphodiesterase class I)